MKTNLIKLGCLGLSWVMVLTVLPTLQVEAQRRRGRGADATQKQRDQETTPQTGEEEQDSKAKQETPQPVTAIVGGDIHTVTGAMLRQGTILVQDGKILEVGQAVEIPEGATVIDATGKTITPGFVAISMQGVGIRSTPSENEKLADALDPFDRNMKYSLGVGITTGCVELASGRGRGRRRRDGEPEERFPGLEQPVENFVTESMLDYGDENTTLCPCCGLPVLPTEPITPTRPTQEQPRTMAVLKMSFGDLDSMLLKEDAFYSPSPGALSSALQRHNWRIEIQKTRDALQAKQKAATEKSTTDSKGNGKKAASDDAKQANPTRSRATAGRSNLKPELVSLINGETAMRIRANTVDEIRDMVELANELDYQIVIEGGIEAWVLAQELGAGEAGVIYTPRTRREPQPGSEDTSGSFFESPRIFQEKGIPFAVATLSNSISMGGLAGRDLTSLPLEAAFAVRGGADERTALQALTIMPATMMGLQDRIGSIEKGKDADLLILNGPPLDYRTYVEQAIVAGKVAYDRGQDRVFPVFDRE